MKKIKKIKITVNCRLKSISENQSLFDLIIKLKIPIKKVAIELNRKIIDKKSISKISLKKNDIIEIVHFIGGG